MRFSPKILLVLALLLNGCAATAQKAEEIPRETAEAAFLPKAADNEIVAVYEKFELFYETDTPTRNFAELEQENPMLGAYIQSNRAYSSIGDFESRTGADYAVYSYNMRLNDPYPAEFVLSCLSLGKIPSITIYPPEEGDIYDKATLKRLSASFGDYKTPMFVQFYPLSTYFDSGEYINFFRMAKQTFAKAAPEAVFVWSAYFKDINGAADFYPGDTYVDWLGLSVYCGYGDFPDITKTLTDFCESFPNKPVMLTELAVSHYDTSDNLYKTAEAAGFLTSLFAAIRDEFTRVKAVIYADVNLIEIGGTADYTISGEEALLSAFALYPSKAMVNAEKSRFFALYDGADILLPEYALSGELNFDGGALSALESVTVNYKKYYSARELSRLGRYYEVDFNEKTIFIR
ncbi:hypothetical protein FACS189490_03700 [Clostridia bacterium]|nr:hypothetical protein FACS189490_03620 [Clostridia bacterium]GHV39686.1 hypothetical protein FACS189490_03700 [Clostridia bacterium]